MYRFLSWMAIGIAAAFLVVATAAFSLPVIKWLAFAIGFGTLIVQASASRLTAPGSMPRWLERRSADAKPSRPAPRATPSALRSTARSGGTDTSR